MPHETWCCDEEDRRSIRARWQKYRIGDLPENAFRDPNTALECLAKFSRAAMGRLATDKKQPDRLASTERDLGASHNYGARILWMAQPEFINVLNAVQRSRGAGAEVSVEELQKTIDRFSKGLFTLPRIEPSAIATDITQKRNGFAPVPTPTVPPVISALQENPTMKSRVFGFNVGGTSQQLGTGTVSGRSGVHLDEYIERNIPIRGASSFDELWGASIGKEGCALLRDADPDKTSIAVGFGAPTVTWIDPITCRRDGHIIHQADKGLLNRSLAPRNATEVETWHPPAWHPTLAQSIRTYLARETEKVFRKIVIGANDTNEGEIAFCGSPLAAGKKTGCVVDGTGFNVCVGNANFEAGHYVGPFGKAFSIPDRIALAQMGGVMSDVECLCSGKTLGNVFLTMVRSCGDSVLTQTVKSMSGVQRDILMFNLAYMNNATTRGTTEAFTKRELAILTPIAHHIVVRAEQSLALMLAGIHMHTGVQVLFGEGSYVRNEPNYVENVNRHIRTLAPSVQHDLLVIERIPVTSRSGRVPTAASFVGLMLDAHGQEVMERMGKRWPKESFPIQE
jgi:hypothetical protein